MHALNDGGLRHNSTRLPAINLPRHYQPGDKTPSPSSIVHSTPPTDSADLQKWCRGRPNQIPSCLRVRRRKKFWKTGYGLMDAGTFFITVSRLLRWQPLSLRLTSVATGHAGAMLQARQLGTELYVGIHSDEAILE